MTTPLGLIPRGIRNNNPGNVRWNYHVEWHGQTGVDAEGFCTFKDVYSGLRCLRVILLNYHALHHCKTIRDYISRYAPHNENNTVAYIDAVCEHMNNSSDTEIKLPEDLVTLMEAIIIVENGNCPYTLKELQAVLVYQPIMA